MFLDLIANGKIKQALDMLATKDVNNYVQLNARFKRIENEKLKGMIKQENYDLEYNRIVNALISYNHLFTSDTKNPQMNNYDSTEEQLLEIMKHYQRRDQGIYTEAKQLLKDIRDYNDNKALDPTYDPVGKKLDIVVGTAKAFVENIARSEDNAKIETIGRIKNLIKDRVPTWEKLTEAYYLSLARGLKNTWIEDVLRIKPDDYEARISVPK